MHENEVGIAGERIRKLVHGYKISWWGDTLRVTVSLGATNVHSNDSVESLIGRAERALQAGFCPGQMTQIRGFAIGRSARPIESPHLANCAARVKD